MGDPARHIAHIHVVCPLARDMGDPAHHITNVHVFCPQARDMGDPACHIAHVYQIVFGIDQFLDFKLTHFPIYCHFCNFDPFLVHFLALFCTLGG